MEWISVSTRVPENRRSVHVWGESGLCFGGFSTPLRSHLLGTTKFNPSRNGGEFDIERHQRFSICRVTHWAEIEGPCDR